MIDNDRLFQTLLEAIVVPGVTDPHEQIAADLDVDSFDLVPFITHNSTIAQDRNGNGLWACTLNLTVFAMPATGFLTVKALYDGVKSWDLPFNGIVPGVGSVESIDDFAAFSRSGGEVDMFNKVVTQYGGSFELLLRQPI